VRAFTRAAVPSLLRMHLHTYSDPRSWLLHLGGCRASTLSSLASVIPIIQPATPARPAASALGTGNHLHVWIGRNL
jgi:hypothetical protein